PTPHYTLLPYTTLFRSFTIANPTAVTATYAITTSCAGVTCALYRPSIVVNAGASDTVRLYFTMPSAIEAAASVKLIATYNPPSGDRKSTRLNSSHGSIS